jgi:hypothetical protein
MSDIEGFDSWWDLERARVQSGRHTPTEACLLAWQAATEQQQSVIDELVEALESSNKELHNWDDSLRISAELLGDSKPTRLPIQKLMNENKALLAKVKVVK